MERYPIIVDTDPGIDDAIALAVLYHYRREDVCLIVASYGNMPLEQTARNAAILRTLLRWEVPVLAGVSAPAGNDSHYVTAEHIHGEDGLAGVAAEYSGDPGPVMRGDYLQKLYDTLRENGTSDYIILGPQTNLAHLLHRFPDARNYIGRVVCMGGGIDMGNVTEVAEFNIHCDASSAEYIMQQQMDIFLVPLNVTSPVAFSLEEIEELTISRKGVAAWEAERLSQFRRILVGCYKNCTGWGERGATMHDSTAVLYYLFPELFRIRKTGISVDCGYQSYGMTFETAARGNVTLVKEAHPRQLLDKIAACLSSMQ